MHGLINRSIQCFVRDTYGTGRWGEIARAIGLGPDGFEAMLSYDDALTRNMIDVACRLLDKPEDMFLEDLGTYLVSHPNSESIRRLLRFGGETFSEFLHSLDDLPDRARMAVPDLTLAALELVGTADEGRYELHVRHMHPEFGYVLVGVLRAMADDYGALVLLDPVRLGPGEMLIAVSLLDSAFAEGRSFTLARPDPGNAEHVG